VPGGWSARRHGPGTARRPGHTHRPLHV